jgi:hypothetical protein
MSNIRKPIQNSDQLDILSAIWIMSCNDENPTITFKGIKYRLGLPESYDVYSLVKSRGELFRLGIPQRRLVKWKQDMLNGSHLPSWVRDIENDIDRTAVIGNISTDDVFRNQFRAGFESPRAPIEIIDWGLEHIERLRRVNAEVSEEKIKRLTGIWIPILSTFIALAAVLSGAYLQLQTLSLQKYIQDSSLAEQRSLKYYEVELKLRQEGYSAFMQHINSAIENASAKNSYSLGVSLHELESTYYDIEPFLVKSEIDQRALLWSKYQEFAIAASELTEQPVGTPKHAELEVLIQAQKDYFHSELYKILFRS